MQLYTISIVSFSATESVYIPLRSVLVPIAELATRTVANSTGLSSLSTTLPDILTLSPKANTDAETVRTKDNANRIFLINKKTPCTPLYCALTAM
jgi:hypothetical protein